MSSRINDEVIPLHSGPYRNGVTPSRLSVQLKCNTDKVGGANPPRGVLLHLYKGAAARPLWPASSMYSTRRPAITASLHSTPNVQVTGDYITTVQLLIVPPEPISPGRCASHRILLPPARMCSTGPSQATGNLSSLPLTLSIIIV